MWIGIGIGIGRTRYGTGGTPASLLLDEYGGAAAAYSLRQLNSDYTGPAIQVRIETESQPTYDIGFVDGELDIATLEGYCVGSGISGPLDAFVTTWYDQSGSIPAKDATQINAENQPQIVSSGSVILENGKPAVQFDGSDDGLLSNLTGDSENYVFISVSNSSSGFILSTYFSTDVFNFVALSATTNYFYRVRNASASINTVNGISTTADQRLLIGTHNSTLQSIYVDNITPVTSAQSFGSIAIGDGLGIGEHPLGGGNFNGVMQEAIVYLTDESSNISGIQTNINDFYSIYGNFDADYQAILDYATTQGYTLPSASQQALQNQLVVDLKDAAVWSKLDLFYVFATDGDRDFAAINWKDPNNHEIVEYNSPTFTTDIGFTGDSSSAYLDTGTTLDAGSNFDPSTPSASLGGWSYYNKASAGNALCGADQLFNRVRGGACRITGSFLVPNTLTNGLYHVNGNSSQSELYVNGSLDTNAASSTTTDSTNYYGLRDSLGYTTDTISIMFSGGDLSTEQSDFYTAVNSYMTSI
jgi:hypothetical protein